MEKQIQAIVCPNCGANAHNHLNCEYCGSILVRFADESQQNELDELKSLIASENMTMLNTAADVIKNGIWTEKRSCIALAWFDNESSEEGVEYKEGEIMITLSVGNDVNFYNCFSGSLPMAVLNLFSFKRVYSVSNNSYKEYVARLGKDYKYAALIWLKVIRAFAEQRGIPWVPNAIQFENKHGLYDYKGNRIDDAPSNVLDAFDCYLDDDEEASTPKNHTPYLTPAQNENTKSNTGRIISLILAIICFILWILNQSL